MKKNIENKTDRFVTVYKQKEGNLSLEATYIIKDMITGISYLYHEDGYAGGMCVLLDSNKEPYLD